MEPVELRTPRAPAPRCGRCACRLGRRRRRSRRSWLGRRRSPTDPNASWPKKFLLYALIGFFVLRFALTMASYGCGAPGGIFAPLLVLGSAIGLAVGGVAAGLFPQVVEHPESFAVVGMAAVLFRHRSRAADGNRADRRNDRQLLAGAPPSSSPVLLPMGSPISWVTDRFTKRCSSGTFCGRSQRVVMANGTMLLDLTIAPGARFAGKRVRELGLPAGCILILVRDGILHEQVPTAESVLNAGDHITALISGEASTAIVALRERSGGIDSVVLL